MHRIFHEPLRPATAAPQSTGVVQLLRRLAEPVLWPLCVLCEGRPVDDWQLCPRCAAQRRWHDRKRCQLCARSIPADNRLRVCAGCISKPPAWNRLFVLGDYEDPNSRIIRLWKHHNCPWYADRFAARLLDTFADELGVYDVLVPVPLHWTRRWQRRFNQADDLARCLAEGLGRPVERPLRRSLGPPLSTLDREHRSRAARRSLHLRARRRGRQPAPGASGKLRSADRVTAQPRARTALLVDDVFTTGATATRCARLLRRAGFSTVGLAVVARTPFHRS